VLSAGFGCVVSVRPARCNNHYKLWKDVDDDRQELQLHAAENLNTIEVANFPKSGHS